MCGIVAVANMQYGLDSACLASLQAMPGFLQVFGYEDPKLRGGYGIDASPPAPTHTPTATLLGLTHPTQTNREPSNNLSARS